MYLHHNHLYATAEFNYFQGEHEKRYNFTFNWGNYRRHIDITGEISRTRRYICAYFDYFLLVQVSSTLASIYLHSGETEVLLWKNHLAQIFVY